MQTPTHQKLPNFRITYFLPSKCRPCSAVRGACRLRPPPFRRHWLSDVSGVDDIFNGLWSRSRDVQYQRVGLVSLAKTKMLTNFVETTCLHIICHHLGLSHFMTQLITKTNFWPNCASQNNNTSQFSTRSAIWFSFLPRDAMLAQY